MPVSLEASVGREGKPMETYESPRVIVLGAVPTHTLATAATVGASCLTKLYSGTDSTLGEGQEGGEVLTGHIQQTDQGLACIADA